MSVESPARRRCVGVIGFSERLERTSNGTVKKMDRVGIGEMRQVEAKEKGLS